MCAAQSSRSVESSLDILARPKANFLKYQDKPSVYWQDKPKMSPTCGLTARQEELAKHRTVSDIYIDDRPSPIWLVTPKALQAVPSPRVERLAEPKSVSQYWMEDRSVYSIVTEEAKRASASARIVQLAKPRNHTGNGIPSRPASNQDEEKDKESPRSNKTVTASARTEELAVPKGEHSQYQHDLSVIRHVSASALQAQASDRVCQLSKPKTRKSLFEGYDPYRISPAAKHAEASSRIVELCTPPARRQRQKKI
ncbi:testicular haploid expressed gene protein [Rana temporaria]|uniref:testicular haploid expressed gene protein n=1 Tax=Rana temporaria TaxID=8407 RepID=UPI001AAC7EF9|nr:testicular haploid expressed gene protein [Rana temporaria]